MTCSHASPNPECQQEQDFDILIEIAKLKQRIWHLELKEAITDKILIKNETLLRPDRYTDNLISLYKSEDYYGVEDLLNKGGKK